MAQQLVQLYKTLPASILGNGVGTLAGRVGRRISQFLHSKKDVLCFSQRVDILLLTKKKTKKELN